MPGPARYSGVYLRHLTGVHLLEPSGKAWYCFQDLQAIQAAG